MPSGPLRWQAAGVLSAHLPNTRGRDRVVKLVRGTAQYSGPVSGRFHNGTTFSFDDVSDGSVRAALTLRYRPPVLAPVLKAALAVGDCFYDVGANLGIYTLWAAPLVGPTGEVHAFEPVPSTRSRLENLVEANRIGHAVVVPAAVGERAGSGHMRTVAGASGLAHLTEAAEADLRTPVVTLDAYADAHRPPTLVKIDVEGHETRVLAGASRLLDTARPAVVMELLQSHLDRSGTTIADTIDTFAKHRYRLYNLTPRGLRPAPGHGSPGYASPRYRSPQYTSNVLALCDDVAAHSRIAARLERHGFARNQTT